MSGANRLSSSFNALSSVYSASMSANPIDVNLFAQKRFLIVENIVEMQRSINMSLNSLGIEKSEFASKASEALTKMAKIDFDGIICSFDLGSTYDGMYLLDEAKSRNLLKPSCLFVMTSSERRAGRIISAAELAPDSLLLKPFTSDELRTRLELAALKRREMQVLDQSMLAHDYLNALELCDKQIQKNPLLAMEFLKTKGSILLKMEEFKSAETLYRTILRNRLSAFASLGLAKALIGQRSYDESKNILEALLAENPNMMEAYDCLAQLHIALHETHLAQDIIDRATQISPIVFKRQVQLAKIAEKNQDLNTAERAARSSLDLSKLSHHRAPYLYVRLAQIQMAKNDNSSAAQTIGHLKRDYKSIPAGEWMAGVIESQLYHKQGQHQKAAELLNRSAYLRGNFDNTLPNEELIEFARVCYMQDRKDLGDKATQELVRNHHDNEALLAQIGDMYDQLGIGDEGRQLISENVQNVVHINNEAVTLAKQARYEEAINLFIKANAEMPANAQVIINMCNAIIGETVQSTWNDIHIRHGHFLLKKLRETNSSNAKVLKIIKNWNTLMSKKQRPDWLI